MENGGIMQEIREHLAEGKSSGEVIALGFKPSTVYTVQRQMRRQGQDSGKGPVQERRAAPNVHGQKRAHGTAGPGQDRVSDLLHRLVQQVAAVRDALFCQVSEGQIKHIFMECSECGSSKWEPNRRYRVDFSTPLDTTLKGEM